jgi:iron complex outermembrane receptor protein
MLGARVSLLGVLGGILLVSPASAQDSTRKSPVVIKKVEVVATRLAKAPHDVPASIEVISGEDLRARGATSLRDALSLADGVAIAPGGDAGPASAVPEFWGLREFDAFLLVVDDVPWGGALNPAIATLSLGDVERIEVLRGPAPVTYGATSFVGVIHVVHNAAAERARYAEAHGGSYGSGGGSIDIPLFATSSWKSRLSADFDRLGFKDDNTAYSKGHGLFRVSSGDAPRRTWLTADLNILQQDPASPHPREGAALSTATPLDANYNPDGAFLNETRLAIQAGLARPVMNGATWSTTASYTFSEQKMFRGFLTDISNAPNNAAGFRENIDVNDVYAETHIAWPSVSKWSFVAGADLLFANGEGKGATFTYTAPLISSTRPSVAEPSSSSFDKDAEDRRIFGGIYGNTEWHPIDRLTFSGGLRLNSTSERHGEENEASTNTRLSGGVGAMLGLWEQDENHLRAFVNYRDTFKPAAFDFSLAENEEVLEPETSRAYEGGLKLRVMDGRMDVEGSVFQMDFTNLVTPTIVNNLPTLINSGETRFKGFELATDLRLPYDVSARASYSYHDGKFVDFVQDFGGTLTQLAGKRFEMSAKHLASAGLSLYPTRGFTANVGVNYSGDRYLNKRNTALAPAFTTVDAGIGYRMDRWEIRLDGRNLGDRRDAISESEFGDAQYYRMPARTVLGRIVVRY